MKKSLISASILTLALVASISEVSAQSQRGGRTGGSQPTQHSTVSGGGLVGFYVYRDAYNRGLLINRFIPGSSAEDLHLQGELYAGDIITRYNGQRVRSAQDILDISSSLAPGEWARMEFQTPNGERFWHMVQPGGGNSGAVATASVQYSFRTGSARPSNGRQSGRGSVSPPSDGGRNNQGPGRPRSTGRGN